MAQKHFHQCNFLEKNRPHRIPCNHQHTQYPKSLHEPCGGFLLHTIHQGMGDFQEEQSHTAEQETAGEGDDALVIAPPCAVIPEPVAHDLPEGFKGDKLQHGGNDCAAQKDGDPAVVVPEYQQKRQPCKAVDRTEREMQDTSVSIVLVHDEVQQYFVEPADEAAQGKFQCIAADRCEWIGFQRNSPLSKQCPLFAERAYMLMQVLPVLRQLQAGCLLL